MEPGLARTDSPSAASPPDPDASRRSLRGWRPSRVAGMAMLIGLAVTLAFALTSLSLYHQNENRLLELRAREVGSVLSEAVAPVQTPLALAAELADATRGDAGRFRAFIAPYVGTGRQFASVSLWRQGVAPRTPLAVLGKRPILASMPRQMGALFARSQRSNVLDVTGILGASSPSLGYAFSTPGAPDGFVVYAENPLPKDRRSKLARNSAFSDLNYALFLGRTTSPAQLLVTSLHQFPITGRQARRVVPFGDTVFTLVVTPNGPLGGTFFRDLPWIVVLVGVLVSLAAALLTDRLARRRRDAEELTEVLDRVAAENHRLYTEQRGIAQTLQHALLPDELPRIAGLEVSARYVPAASGINVGGDWFDLVALGEGRALLVIGDVSGHGLRAATTMASLRHVTLAYAAEGHGPAAVLAKLAKFVNKEPHDHFATVLCVMIDVTAGELTLASAGHMPPLILDEQGAGFIELEPDPPIGALEHSHYRETTVAARPTATLVAFTDGLVERRGEVIDAGLERLRAAAAGQRLGLDALLSKLIGDLASDDHHDDTAIVGARWQR